MNKMHVNIIHRPSARSQAELEGFEFQQKLTHDLGIRSTILVPYPVLFNKELIERIKKDHQEYGDEIGIWLHDYLSPEYYQDFECNEMMFWLLPDANKRDFARRFLEKFKLVFGVMPKAVGSYVMDSASIKILKALAPQICVSVATCFEEGVNMYHGTHQCWHLLNDGGPWSAWYPSSENAFCPARDEEEGLDVVAVPHLTRDMVLSILGRNDFFASHPPNMLRGKVYDGPDSAYHLNFIDQWIHQAAHLNGHGYYNIHVSLGWIIGQHFYEEPVEVSRQLYADSLAHLARRRDEGFVAFDTMSEYAAYHKKTVPHNKTEWCHWEEMLEGTGFEYLWAINPSFRAIFDLSRGGSIVDLRPYAGRLVNSTGSDESGLWSATYPYLVNSHLRHGMNSRVGGCSIISAWLECNGKRISLPDLKSEVEILPAKGGEGADEVRFAPVTLDFNGITAILARTILVDESHRIVFRWKLISISDTNCEIKLTQYFSGSVGENEYPVDNRGTLLYAKSDVDALNLTTRYAGINRSLPNARLVSADMEKANTRLTLSTNKPSIEGFLHDEPLFCPYFNIGLTLELKIGEEAELCLNLTKL